METAKFRYVSVRTDCKYYDRLVVNVKVRFTLEQPMKTQVESRGIPLLFL